MERTKSNAALNLSEKNLYLSSESSRSLWRLSNSSMRDSVVVVGGSCVSGTILISHLDKEELNLVYSIYLCTYRHSQQASESSLVLSYALGYLLGNRTYV